MATVFREPLVFGPQQKRPIAPVDYFSRPLTLGINPNARALELSASAPAARLAVNSDRYPNLLLSTLAAGAAPALSLPLNSGRLFDSAPRKPWQGDPLTAQGFLVCPDAPIQGLDASAPQKSRFLGQLQPPNLLTSTLGAAPAAPQFAIRLDAPAPSIKYQVRTESLSRPLTLGINANAAALSIIDSANPRKVSAYSFDPPNLLGTTLAVSLALPLNAVRIDASAPSVKYQVRTETLYRPLTLGINPNAAVGQITDSATPRKRSAYPFDPPNLLITTLVVPLALPLRALRLDWSAPPPKVIAYLFHPLNRSLYIPPFVEPALQEVVPYLIGDTEAAARARIAGIRCVASVIGSSGTVTAQDPAHMTVVSRGTTITITLGGTANNPPRAGSGRGWPNYGSSVN